MARLLAFSDSFVLSDPLVGRFIWALTWHPEAAGSLHRKWEMATPTVAYMLSGERNHMRGLWRMWGSWEGNFTHSHPEMKAWGLGDWGTGAKLLSSNHLEEPWAFLSLLHFPQYQLHKGDSFWDSSSVVFVQTFCAYSISSFTAWQTMILWAL